MLTIPKDRKELEEKFVFVKEEWVQCSHCCFVNLVSKNGDCPIPECQGGHWDKKK